MPTMNVSLTESLSKFVERVLAGGEYGSASEVVRDALRLLKREKALEKERLDILRREIATGVAQAKRGRLSSRSVEEIANSVAGRRKG